MGLVPGLCESWLTERQAPGTNQARGTKYRRSTKDPRTKDGQGFRHEPKHQGPTRNTRMPVDPELLEILACPHCKTKVELVKNGTALKCAQCKRVYAIKDDIPVMLIDEATIEP